MTTASDHRSAHGLGVWPNRISAMMPGLIASGVVAVAATFLSDHYNAPVMLFALLLGLGMNFLSSHQACKPGIDFAGKTLLRLGVALLGARITLDSIVSLGWGPLAIILIGVAATICISVVAAKLAGFNPLFGLLSGGATAICGASAALALSAALPQHPLKERATVFTVVGVSILSTVAMIVYPMIAGLFGFDHREAGIFLGATIHDVAQVVGAGYSMSPETGDTATVVKLARVGLLFPVIMAAAIVTRSQGAQPGAERPPLLPWFAAGFLLMVGANSMGLLAAPVQGGAVEASRWCLVVAISALGMKTQLREVAKVGLKPILFMFGETVLLAAIVVALMNFLL